VSRPSRLATLLRVADIKEASARGEAAGALRRTSRAQQELADRTAALSQSGLAGGTRSALERTTQTRLLRAATANEAGEAARLAHLASDAALGAWTDARQRRRLFEELRNRSQAEQQAAREHEEQRQSDELAAQRRDPW
jgi:flagellar biosynthesis chaperone FliJ